MTKRVNPHIGIVYERIYFLGIGGIGMSALARYFHRHGYMVAGYDKTSSSLTDELQEEGIPIHFEDKGRNISEDFKDKGKTLVVFTPAIPSKHGELLYFRSEEFTILKRSEVLGLLTENSKGIGVAGTHGKTTTSSMLAWVLQQSSLGCNAFLGGIATNFNSNLVTDQDSPYTVIEADEFDRSFLKLHPFASIITSTDPDHLDIYGDKTVFLEGFQLYCDLIAEDGLAIIREGLDLKTKAKNVTYAIESTTADYHGERLRMEDGCFQMDVTTPTGKLDKVELGIPGIHNAENALACIAMCQFLGLSESEIRSGLASFLGVKRRFEYQIRTKDLIYIDDYAHHPTEINALIDSVRLLYPGRKLTGIFQPHLFSRTRDFFDEFANALSRLDETILLPIYPAREEPIEGVTSDALLDKLTNKSKRLCLPDEVANYISSKKNDIVLTIGAGDIDRVVGPLKQALE